jgi:hypothetical protein
MHTEYEFQARIPVKYGMELITLVRSDQRLSRKGEAVELAGAILGESGALLCSFENPVFSDVPCTLEACCDALEAELESLPEEGVAAMNPLIMALLVQLIKKLLEELL